MLHVENLDEKRRDLQALIHSLPALSSFREDLVVYLKKLLISDFALKFNFKKVLLGTSSQKIAENLLNAICKGRGSSVPHEISFIDDKNFGGRISFMNPMRDFLMREIALYNYNRSVPLILQWALSKVSQEKEARPTTAPCFGSTDLLMTSFFSRLQDKYNVNTVPTVVRLT